MPTVREELNDLADQAELLEEMRTLAKTDGDRLSEFGQDMVLVMHRAGFKNGKMAKILEVTPSAISQQVAKLTKTTAPKKK